ncbi:MAG: hypothetical protein ACREYF_07295 [Gammaproteobacteria bacterium]
MNNHEKMPEGSVINKWKPLCLLLLLMLSALLCRAHYLWIEPQGTGAIGVYFGEYQEGLKEQSGGRLDERAGLEGSQKGQGRSSEALHFEKKQDHFLTKIDPKAEWILVQDTANPVKDWSDFDIGIVKPMFYTRAAAADRLRPAAPVLTLDVLPVAGRVDEVQVFFRQAPLPKAKVFVYAPNQWLQDLKTDGSGKVRIQTPWPGRYVVDVVYNEPAPGEFKGAPYRSIRHRATLSFVVNP